LQEQSHCQRLIHIQYPTRNQGTSAEIESMGKLLKTRWIIPWVDNKYYLTQVSIAGMSEVSFTRSDTRGSLRNGIWSASPQKSWLSIISLSIMRKLIKQVNRSMIMSRSSGLLWSSGSTGINRENAFHGERCKKTSHKTIQKGGNHQRGMTGERKTAQEIGWQTWNERIMWNSGKLTWFEKNSILWWVYERLRAKWSTLALVETRGKCRSGRHGSPG
jgi:hypothetical protein